MAEYYTQTQYLEKGGDWYDSSDMGKRYDNLEDAEKEFSEKEKKIYELANGCKRKDRWEMVRINLCCLEESAEDNRIGYQEKVLKTCSAEIDE